jgi:outer membrane protein assembly factor BamB
VAASDGKVFCGSKNGILYAIQESDGHLAWKYEPPQVSDMSAIFTTPLVSGGKVYFGSLTGYVRALDELTGSQIWAFKASDMEANSSPVMSNQTIYFGGRHDYLYAVDAATGMERWRSVNINGTINDAPLLDGGSVIFTVTEYDPTGGSIYAMEAMTGLQQWRFQTFNERSGDFGPLVVGNRVFCTASGIGEKRDENYMYALNRKTGQMVWKRRIPKAMTSLALYKSGLVFGSTDGLYIVSVTDGSLQFYEKTGEIQMSKPAIVGSTAYVGSNDHNLYAVTLPNILTTSPLAASYPMVNTAIAVGTGGSSTIGTGGRTSGSLGVGRSTPDPAIFELQQENNQLADQIKTLQLKNVNSHNDIQRLNKELIETRESIAERDAAMARLQNTLRLTDETSHSKDETVEDMRKTLERWKIHNSSDNSPPLESPKVSTVDEQPGKC